MVEQLRKPLFSLFEFFVSQIVLVTRRFVLVDEGGRWKSEIEVVHYGSTRVTKITQKSLACGSFCRCVTFSLHIPKAQCIIVWIEQLLLLRKNRFSADAADLMQLILYIFCTKNCEYIDRERGSFYTTNHP